MVYTIFYSWQSDLPNNKNRSFIETCIKQAIKATADNFDTKVFFAYDRDTLNITGSPDIAETIFNKIDQSDLFIGDISIINSGSNNRKTPNPNVLVELGYAANALGWERVICVCNTDYGGIDDLPFDLRQKRIVTFGASDNKQKVANAIATTLRQLYGRGLLFHPIKDHIKGKIDYCVLEIIKQLSCLIFGTITMTDALAKVNDCMNLERTEIVGIFEKNARVMGFFAHNNLNEVKRKLEGLLDASLSSKHIHDAWVVAIIDLIHWLRGYSYLIANRKGALFSSVFQPNPLFGINSAHEMSSDNPKDSYLLLKNVGVDNGKVLYVASIPKVQSTVLLSPHRINNGMIEEFSSCLYRVIEISRRWLKVTGDEFVLDPEFYYIT